jgi:uncharacterized YokU family protein
LNLIKGFTKLVKRIFFNNSLNESNNRVTCILGAGALVDIGGPFTSQITKQYWELPDGSRAIEITATPAVICRVCDMVYQIDVVTKEIEDQLFLVDTKAICNSISFKELMELPRLLKRNYFDFSS